MVWHIMGGSTLSDVCTGVNVCGGVLWRWWEDCFALGVVWTFFGVGGGVRTLLLWVERFERCLWIVF